MTPAHQEMEPPLTLDSFGPKLNASKFSDHSTSVEDEDSAHNPSFHKLTALCQADPGPPCSRQVPVELLHWVVEDFVGAGKDDPGGPLCDRRLLVLRWALFSAGHRTILHSGWIPWCLELPLYKPSSTETAGGAESQA